MQATEQLPLTNDQLLQKAILLNPHDDAPRLQYADWLEERDGHATCPKCSGARFMLTNVDDVFNCMSCDGQGVVSNNYGLRAEFIRFQIRDVEVHPIERTDREFDLGHAHQNTWFKIPFPLRFSCLSAYTSDSNTNTTCRVARRGFIDEIHCTMDEFMQHSQAIARCHPVTKWVIMDAEPWNRRPDNKKTHEFAWLENASGIDGFGVKEGVLPSQLFKYLRFGLKRRFSVEYYRGEDAKQEAIADLDQACFHCAREGLEDYVPPPTPAIL